jgi:hypothetical protein
MYATQDDCTIKIIDHREIQPASINSATWPKDADMRKNAIVLMPTINNTTHEIKAAVLARRTTPSTDASIK